MRRATPSQNAALCPSPAANPLIPHAAAASAATGRSRRTPASSTSPEPAARSRGGASDGATADSRNAPSLRSRTPGERPRPGGIPREDEERVRSGRGPTCGIPRPDALRKNGWGGGKTARPDGESAPALLPRKASRDLSPPGRSPGFRLPGGPRRAASLLSAPSRPRSRHPGSGSAADFVTGYSCGAAMDSHHLPLPRRERSDLRDHSAARRPMRQGGIACVPLR